MSITLRRTAACGRWASMPLLAAAAAALTMAPAASARRAHGSHAITKQELTQLKVFIAKEQQAPKWRAPGPPVKGSVLKGKTVVVFPISSDVPSCEAEVHDAQALGRQLGAKIVAPASTTGPTGWASNLNLAITDHASAAVMICSIAPGTVSPQLSALAAHHIPVVDGNLAPAPPALFSGLSAASEIQAARGVRDDLADALIQLHGKPAHILYVTSSQAFPDAGVGSPSSDTKYGAYPALKAAIKRWCPGSCTINQIDNLETTQWTTDGAGVASYLNANPSINTVIVAFDGEEDNMITEVAAAAATHPGLKIYNWGAGPAELRDLQHNKVVAADSGPDPAWCTYAAFDQVIRLVAHKKPVPLSKEVAPNVFYTKANAAGFFTGPTGDGISNKLFSHGAFIKDYDTLWGVKPKR